MVRSPVPRISRKSATPQPPCSDTPTYVLVGSSTLCAVLGGLVAGLLGAVIFGLVALIGGGGLYTILASRLGWPQLRWDAVPWIIP